MSILNFDGLGWLPDAEHPTPCKGRADVWTSTDKGDHLEARQGCLTCPLIDTCATNRPPAYDFPEGTYAGDLYVNGRRVHVKYPDLRETTCEVCSRPVEDRRRKYHPGCRPIAVAAQRKARRKAAA